MTPNHTSAVVDRDLLSQELSDDPHRYFAELRSDDPVHWDPRIKGWLVTRYADVNEAAQDSRLSSDRVRPLLDVLPPERYERQAPLLSMLRDWMVVTDPPAHTRLRTLANSAFRQQRVTAMSEWIGELVDELLDEFVASGADDFLSGFAYPLPATIIARMFGAPVEDRDRFQRWSDELALVAFGAGGDARPERHERAMAGLIELQEYLRVLIERARERGGDDMIAVLLRGEAGGDHLTEQELVSLCSLLLFAGHETTTNLLCNGLLALTRHPDQMATLAERPDLVNRAVEEMLRYDGPIKILTRWVTEDHERGGHRIEAGQRVFLVLASANRDADVFPEPDRFDITRPTRPLHLGFGRGVHACVGAQLARLEARIAIPRILQRLPGLHLVELPSFRPSLASRAVRELRVAHA